MHFLYDLPFFLEFFRKKRLFYQNPRGIYFPADLGNCDPNVHQSAWVQFLCAECAWDSKLRVAVAVQSTGRGRECAGEVAPWWCAVIAPGPGPETQNMEGQPPPLKDFGTNENLKHFWEF